MSTTNSEAQNQIPSGYRPATREDIAKAAKTRSSREFIYFGGALYMDNRWAITRLISEVLEKVQFTTHR